jgi:hypothetical protein
LRNYANVTVCVGGSVGIPGPINEIVGDSRRPGDAEYLYRIRMRASTEPRAAKVISCDNASREIDRVGRRVKKRVIFNGYGLARDNPHVRLGR